MNLHLAAIFGDDMVLQREVPVPLWGSAPAGAEVAAEMDGQSVRARAGEDGLWRLELPAGPAGGPCALTVRCGEDEITLRRVYRGEVWLAGGQSNMELALKDSLDGGAAVRDSANPRLHHYKTPKAATPAEAELLRGQYSEILPGFYCDKRTWIACLLDGELPDEVLRDLCAKSHRLVLGKLPKYVQREILGD